MGVRKNQLIMAPDIIAAKESRIIGRVRRGSSSWVLWSGENDEGDHKRETARRVEYEAVRMVAKRKTNRIKRLEGLNRSISRIRSFE